MLCKPLLVCCPTPIGKPPQCEILFGTTGRSTYLQQRIDTVESVVCGGTHLGVRRPERPTGVGKQYEGGRARNEETRVITPMKGAIEVALAVSQHKEEGATK